MERSADDKMNYVNVKKYKNNIWDYKYRDIGGKIKHFNSKNLNSLYLKVKRLNLPWSVEESVNTKFHIHLKNDTYNVKTIHGNVRFKEDGFYHITSTKEGHHGQTLQRAIYIDYYGEIPYDMIVDLVDDNPCNCDINNLILLSNKEYQNRHYRKYHGFDSFDIDRFRDSADSNRSSTGISHVCMVRRNGYTLYRYNYVDDDGVLCSFSAYSLEDLECIVKGNGFDWLIVPFNDSRLGGVIVHHYTLDLNVPVIVKGNKYGLSHVCKVRKSSTNQGFLWRYTYSVNGKDHQIHSVDLGKLKVKVESLGLPWKEVPMV